MNDLSQILLTILLNTGLMTIATAVMYRKQNKKLKDLEVAKARIESKNDEWHFYKEQLESAFNRIKELLEVNREKEGRLIDKDRLYSERITCVEERFNKQTTHLREVQRNLTETLETVNRLTLENGRLRRYVVHLKTWLCCKPWSRCKEREPEQKVKPERYIPFDSAEDRELRDEELEPRAES